MQTFLPYSDFARTASVLDRKRLGKQRVETLQIIQSLVDPTHGWRNHPAVKMWRGHALALLKYQFAICDQWTSYGYKDTCLEKSMQLFREHPELLREAQSPRWLGDAVLHLSHRSNLLRKAPDHYAPLFESTLTDDLDYFWPEP